MIVVLFLSILISILIVVLILCLSTIKLSIEGFELNNIDADSEDYNKKANKIDEIIDNINIDINLAIKILLLNKIPILRITMNKNKILKVIEKIKLKSKLENLAVKDLTNERNIDMMHYITESNVKLEVFRLEMDIGTEDAIITSFLTAGIASGMGVILSKVIEKFDDQKYKYAITPIYKNKNIVRIGLNCIISTKVVHIINIVYMFFKKRRVDKNERTSNRRSYDYGYE